MEYIKRIAVILLIALISVCAVFYSYYGIKNGSVVFAEDYTLMSDEELEAAYQAYLQSKGGSLLGSAGGRITYMNGKLINFLDNNPSISVSTGIASVNDLKNAMYWRKNTFEDGNHLQLVLSNGAFEFLGLYTQWLLQNKYFGNGASLDDETGLFNDGTDDTVYDGKKLTDNNGNEFLVWIVNGAYNKNLYTNSSVQEGSFIQGKFAYNISNGDTISFSYYNDSSWKNKSYTFNTSVSGKEFQFASNNNADYSYGYGNSPLACTSNPYRVVGKCTYINEYYHGQRYTIGGGFGYCYSTTSDKLYVGCIGKDLRYEVTYINADTYFDDSYKNNLVDIDLSFYTNNNLNITEYPDIEAEGNLYITPKVKINGEYKPYTINEGDNITNVVNNYYTDSGDKDKTIAEPTSTPDSGGGGGGNNPSGGTPPNWNNPYPNLSPDGEGGFNFNFTLPDLNIDWNINGLTEKFPFSIPFDFIAFCRVLNAEPQTPEWSGTLVLPMYSHHFTFSLQQFDTVAVILRNLEFIGFCIGLILATRALIKG